MADTPKPFDLAEWRDRTRKLVLNYGKSHEGLGLSPSLAADMRMQIDNALGEAVAALAAKPSPAWDRDAKKTMRTKIASLGHINPAIAGPLIGEIMGEIEALAAKEAPPAFQQRVQPWLLECFGPVIAADRQERNHRFLEESLELVQACGCTASEAHQLVDYVYGRPAGEKAQEVGGVMVTLAALCLAQGLDMHAAGEVELARINEPAMVEKIRAKQAAKPKHSPLPEVPPVRKQEPALWIRKDHLGKLLGPHAMTHLCACFPDKVDGASTVPLYVRPVTAEESSVVAPAVANQELAHDPLYGAACWFCEAENRVSISMVQRCLRIGYNRAARLIEQMEKDGIATSCDEHGRRELVKGQGQAAHGAKGEGT